MKKKVVVKVCMNCEKSRTKAMKIAVGVSGVESAALKGDDKTQIEVTGDGMDAVELVNLLRKKVGPTELVSVGPAGGGDKKKDENNEKKEPKVQVPPYHCPTPYYKVVAVDHGYDTCFNCSIM